MKKLMTIVFDVKDKETFKAYFDAHLKSECIHGGYPKIIADGDQITIPNEIVDGLSNLDADGHSMHRNESGNRTLLRELIATADGYLSKK